ncbi:uncharacterized protein LOC131680008 [Topomyia yanbarensis]|uniref:uncharacterized protein LOC131680008 n=1 Tax=Topomyia yanbarensis TaxID=2498891 RepID=UPI00273B56F1|nr:uncharacterized protein LOC131680008 [Topomyia yanbarensis]
MSTRSGRSSGRQDALGNAEIGKHCTEETSAYAAEGTAGKVDKQYTALTTSTGKSGSKKTKKMRTLSTGTDAPPAVPGYIIPVMLDPLAPSIVVNEAPAANSTALSTVTGTLPKDIRQKQKGAQHEQNAIIEVSCPLCSKPDDMLMVQCDDCKKWFHFRCVNVDQRVEHEDWSCQNCKIAKKTSEGFVINDDDKSFHPAKVTSRKSSQESSRWEHRKELELKLQRLEEEDRFERELQQKLAEQARQAKKDFLDKKYGLLKELEQVDSDTSSLVYSVHSEESKDRTHQWVKQIESASGTQRRPIKSHLVPTPPEGQKGQGKKAEKQLRHHINLNPPSLIPHQSVILNQSSIHSAVDLDGTLNRSQIAARHAVSKELPLFSGDAEEWPIFYSTFNSTTTMCGYTNEENVVRLQKCLKGRALEAVKCRLLHPSNVPGILATLRMLFGRPEIIIHSAIEKIHALPAPRAEQLESLVEFALSVQNLCATIVACEVEDWKYNITLLQELVEKLPPPTRLDWAKYRRLHPDTNLEDFSAWLYDLAENASLVIVPKLTTRSNRRSTGYINAHAEDTEYDLVTETPENAVLHASQLPVKKCCVVCEGICTTVDKCKRFLEFSRSSRWAVVREKHLCKKCLKKHSGRCRKQGTCGVNGCTFNHHPLVHFEANPQHTTATPDMGRDVSIQRRTLSEEPTSGYTHMHRGRSSSVLFRIVPVRLRNRNLVIHTYAFLDNGSSLTLMEQELASELCLNGKPQPLCLTWTADTRRYEPDSRAVSVNISGVCGTKWYSMNNIQTVQSLKLPRQTMNIDELKKKYSHLQGLQIDSYTDVQPRILIGLDNTTLGFPQQSREGKPNEPVATKTCLGWVIYGSCGDQAPSHNYQHHSLHMCSCNPIADQSMNETVKQYFSLESLGITKPDKFLISAEEQRAETILNTLTRRRSKHYELGLLWKYDNIRLPNSFPMAQRRFRCLEKRLALHPNLAENLQSKIIEYIQKGYARKLSGAELSMQHSRVWYLPTFPVVNPNKPCKVRIVWDAAATAFGVSLNSFLLKGPDQLTSLLSILLKFREHRVGICGDIREMFHQILIRKEDQHCQRFLWREEGDPEPAVYIMLVMTFGACCSPSSAQFIKNQNARRYSSLYPEAVDAIVYRHYVDDMLVSVESEQEAIKIAREVKYVHSQGGFEMRNWISNSKRVVEALEEQPKARMNLNIGTELATEKVLGLWWCTEEDEFSYKASPRHDSRLLTGERRPTKREVLRTLMTIFDPLGLIANFLMYLKILLQEIWRSGVGWDDEIYDEQFTKWKQWLDVLHQATVSEKRENSKMLS